MRLLVLHPWAGAPERQRQYISLAEATGWRIDLVTGAVWKDDYGRVVRATRHPEFRGDFFTLPVILPGNLPLHSYRARIASLLRTASPDAIYVYLEPYAAATFQFFLANQRGRHVPIAFHSGQNIHKRYPWPFFKTEQYVFRHGALAITSSAAVQGVLEAKGFLKPIFVVPNSVDIERFAPAVRVNRPSHSPILRLGYFGRLVPQKGVESLLRAMHRLPPRSLLLHIVGSGPDRLRLHRLSQTLGIEEAIEWSPAVGYDDMPALYRSVDAIVVPSRTTPTWKEQFGRVVIEAGASGVPVIASDSGQLPQLVKESTTGWVFPEGNDEALAARIAWLQAGPHRLRRAAARARAGVIAQFSDVVVTKQLAAALTHLSG